MEGEIGIKVQIPDSEKSKGGKQDRVWVDEGRGNKGKGKPIKRRGDERGKRTEKGKKRTQQQREGKKRRM